MLRLPPAGASAVHEAHQPLLLRREVLRHVLRDRGREACRRFLGWRENGLKVSHDIYLKSFALDEDLPGRRGAGRGMDGTAARSPAFEGAALRDARPRLAPHPCGRRGRGAFRHAQFVVVRPAHGRGLIDAAPVAAVDATGLEARHVSAYFGLRRGGEGHRRRAGPKLTVVIHAHSHLIIGAVPGVGPSQDSPDFMPALRQAAGLVRIDTALGDAGYDAEHNHRLCREDLGARQTVIRLNRRNTGRRWPKTPYRRAGVHPIKPDTRLGWLTGG